MVIALIITAIALHLLQWRSSKKCIDNYKLIAQEWRETAEALKDEITLRKLQLDEQVKNHSTTISAFKNAEANKTKQP